MSSTQQLPCDQPGNPSPCPFCGATDYNLGCPEKSARYERISACNDALVEALEYILPMAKGYAHEHPVGRNREIVEEAEAALIKAKGYSA